MSEVETVEVKEQTPEQAEKQLYDGLREQFGDSAPSKEKVDQWKVHCGRVRFLYLSENEVYFFRPIKRAEYKGIIESIGKTPSAENESFMRERVVAQCVLWPKMDPAQMADTFAGTVETLYSAVMEASNFITPEALYTIIREL